MNAISIPLRRRFMVVDCSFCFATESRYAGLWMLLLLYEYFRQSRLQDDNYDNYHVVTT